MSNLRALWVVLAVGLLAMLIMLLIFDSFGEYDPRASLSRRIEGKMKEIFAKRSQPMPIDRLVYQRNPDKKASCLVSYTTRETLNAQIDRTARDVAYEFVKAFIRQSRAKGRKQLPYRHFLLKVTQASNGRLIQFTYNTENSIFRRGLIARPAAPTPPKPRTPEPGTPEPGTPEPAEPAPTEPDPSKPSERSTPS